MQHRALYPSRDINALIIPNKWTWHAFFRPLAAFSA
jgi:hypothetical protein